MNRTSVVAAAVALAVSFAFAMTAGRSNVAVLVVVLIAACLTLGTVWLKTARGLLGLEPVVPTFIAAWLFFVVRPLWDIAHGQFEFVDIDVSDTYLAALFVVLLMLTALLVGYTAAGTRPTNGPTAVVGRISQQQRHVSAWLAIVLGLIAWVGLAVEVKLAGGLHAFWSLRSQGLGSGLNVAAISQLVLLGIPAALMATTAFRGRVATICVVLFTLGPLLATVTRGDRRYVLPAAASLTIWWLIKRGRRIRPLRWTAIGVGLLIVFVIPVELSRGGTGLSYNQALRQTVTSPGTALDNLLSSQTTAMIDNIALGLADLQPAGDVPLGRGRFLLAETLLQPVPQQVWSGKPDTVRNVLIAHRFSLEGGGCASLCPTYTVAISLYADYGWLGLAVLSLMLGYGMKRWFMWCFAPTASAYRVAAYVALLPAFFTMWWGGLSDVTVGFILTALPLLVVDRAARTTKLEDNSAIQDRVPA